MAVTRSTHEERAQRVASLSADATPGRGLERLLLLIASVLVVAAVVLTAEAHRARIANPNPAPLNLADVDRREQLLPYLGTIASPQEKQYVARKLFDFARANPERLSHVGAIARVRVPLREVLSTRGLPDLQKRAKDTQAANPNAESMPLFTAAEVSNLKPLFVVREYSQYRNRLILWCTVFLLAFGAVHVFWTVRSAGGPQYLLPALLLLSGIGLALMVTLRDPLRDTLALSNFAQGTVLGCVALALASTLDYRRLTGKLSYLFLLASFVLSAALILFGSGPSGSDARVNLLGIQPAEIIRILIVFFLAGYFAERWQFLRALHERRPQLQRVSRWIEVPRLEYLVPVLVGVVVALAFFFLQKDLGPALLIACMFLAMYSVARDRYLLATIGLFVILAGFASGYFLGIPKTVSGRVAMWLSPWSNAVRGGEQVAHSFWAFATGGLLGTGPGLGDPQLMPAAHTDLILAVLGEEWGFVGVSAVLLLYAALVLFGMRTALRARSDYNFFLALGLTLALALQIALIAGGVLGLIPLSGVVVPFLSFGRTAMITNFAIIGILVALARDNAPRDSQTEPFRATTRGIAYALALIGAAVLVKAAYIQVVRPDAIAGAGALALQADGQQRYEYNPRLLAIARSIPRGTIFDRNDLPLASSNWDEIAQNAESYARIGVPVSRSPEAGETRFYPLGAKAFHLLGDLRTRANWGAQNSSLAERDFMVALQGYDDRATVVEVRDPHTSKPAYRLRYDYRELLPLLRHRWQPDHPDVKKVRDRDRNLHLSLDSRLQLRAADLLETQLRRLGKTKGAAVVLDPATGDLLASVSYPWPSQMPPRLTAPDSDDTMLDRARYGLYPPGSSFKIVTSIAALRKDPRNAEEKFVCKRLPDGRVGNYVQGWSHPIHDDIRDTSPHGSIAMRDGLAASCNAYFAQLGTYRVGPQMLLDTANLLGISVANPATVDKLRGEMPQTSYGQGQVVATPFQMARVAATIAGGGTMPYGRWVTDQNNPRTEPPRNVLAPQLSSKLAEYMRAVVTNGTGRSANVPDLPIAGKTGTAELQQAPSHAWFIGFAPYGSPHPLAFAVLVENGQYGGTAAAPVAAELMKAARELGYMEGAR